MSNVNGIKGLFVCNNCWRICSDGKDNIGPYGPNLCPVVYPGRKTKITCLGPLCDSPCDLQKDKCEVSKKVLVEKIKYMVVELNKILIK